MGDVRTHACVSVWLVYSKAWVLSKGSLCQFFRQAIRVLIRMCGVLLISRATGHPRVDQDLWSAPDFTRDTNPCQNSRQAIRVLIRICGVLLISRVTQTRAKIPDRPSAC